MLSYRYALWLSPALLWLFCYVTEMHYILVVLLTPAPLMMAALVLSETHTIDSPLLTQISKLVDYIGR